MIAPDGYASPRVHTHFSRKGSVPRSEMKPPPASASASPPRLGMSEEWAVKNVAFTPPLVHPYASREAAVADMDGAPPHVRRDLRLVRRWVTSYEAAE